ncbi:MAG: hypothetical protein WC619_01825 [Patescibacteria group bacterium]
MLKELISNYKNRKMSLGLYDEVDERNFGAEVIAGNVTKADLTDQEFQTFQPVLMDQLDTDFCVGAGKAYFKQATERVIMSFAGAFAMGARALGYVPEWGISILQVMKGACGFGVPEEDKWKYEAYSILKPLKSGRNYFANWKNMPQDTLDNAAKHKDQSFFQINLLSGWDQFDTFRAYLNKFKDKRIVIQTGVDDHNITLIGQKVINGVIKLFGPDSYGTQSINYRIGKSIDGFRYFSRTEANQLFTGYIAFDMPRALAELLNLYNNKAIKLKDNPECFLVKNGEKHSLVNETIAWAHNTLLFDPNYVSEISQEDFDKIPTGEPAKFKDGQNWQIVRRILEKLNKLDLINET